MGNEDFVVLGLDSVEDAMVIATAHGWIAARAPGRLVSALRTDGRCRVLTRADARVAVVVTPAPLPCRAAGWWTTEGRVAMDHRGLSFRALLHSCPTTESLVADLVPSARAVSA